MSYRTPLYFLLLAGILVVAFLAGVSYLAIESLYTEDGWGVENFVYFFGRSDYIAVLLRTIKVSILATVFCAMIGYPIAYAIANFRGNRNLLKIGRAHV